MFRVARWLLAVAGIVVFAGLPLTGAGAQGSGDWPTYLDNGARTGFNSAEAIISPATASSLTKRWTVPADGLPGNQPISAEPVTANGVVYYGSWDGYEYAVDAATGAPLWQSPYLGQTTGGTGCNDRPTLGVASTATIGTITVNGTATEAVFVGGGDGNFYALNASTGAVIWHTPLGTPPGFYLWSSPVLYNGSIYEGLSSYEDCPLIRGGMVQMDTATGLVLHTLYTVPSGCRGASVWGSPTVDTATGDIYFGTGNAGGCPGSSEPLAYSLIKADSSLNILSSWRVPSSQLAQKDNDWGSTSALFTATINGAVHQMVGMENKNGIYYAFDRSAISSGPLWQKRTGAPGTAPQKGMGPISPSAYNGKKLFVGSEDSLIKGVTCAGSVRQLYPSSGKALWTDCLQSGPVLGAVTMVPGVTFVCAGPTVYAINSGTGAILWSFTDPNPGSDFFGAPTISNGQLYVGNQDGILYAFGPSGAR
jgi:outer membrane protein assembly factor BamB